MFWLYGGCPRGTACKYVHTAHPPGWVDTRVPPGSAPKGADACRDFTAGTCRRGANCRFAHARSTAGSTVAGAAAAAMPEAMAATMSASFFAALMQGETPENGMTMAVAAAQAATALARPEGVQATVRVTVIADGKA